MHHPTHQQTKEAAHVSPIMPDQPDELVSIKRLTPERLAEIKSLLSTESSISFHSARAKESMLLLVAEVEALNAERDRTETRVRESVAQDFIRQGKASDRLTWGQAVYIARDGLCGCSGGLKPCDMGGAR
jgi:hypothetical protein